MESNSKSFKRSKNNTKGVSKESKKKHMERIKGRESNTNGRESNVTHKILRERILLAHKKVTH